MKHEMPILQVGDVLLSPDILTEPFCCDLEQCHGICCVEGDAGAPVTIDEIGLLEDRLADVWPLLSARAQSVIDRQGVAYNDCDGDLVTSIVGGRECVFLTETTETAATPRGCHLCALEVACNRQGPHSGEAWVKPVSCALYPIREKRLSNGLVGLNYNRWDICRPAIEKGRKMGLPVYRFLRAPLTRRFGEAWYDELCQLAEALAQREADRG